MRYMAHRTMSYPVNAPPPPLEEPNQGLTVGSTGRGLSRAIDMRHEEGTEVSHWIACGNSQNTELEGEMALGRYLELLRTLERKNKKYLISIFIDAQVFMLKGFLVSRLMEFADPVIAARLYSPLKMRNWIQSEILVWLPEGEERNSG